MYQQSKYAILRGFELNILSFTLDRVLNIPQLPGYEYIRILNMSGFIKNMLHHIHA